jgi:hypothetical protein
MGALGALEPVWDELDPAEQSGILRLLIGGATKPRPSPLYSDGVYCRMSPLIGGNLPAPQFSPVIPAWNALGARGGRRKRASRAAD